MLHLRVVCPGELTDQVVAVLGSHKGVIVIRRSGATSHGEEVHADLAREAADAVLHALRELRVHERGMLSTEPLDTAIGQLVERAEADAPGEAADAVVWEELAGRTGEDSVLTGAYLAFMVLATTLAAIGVVTDSPVTVVGAMVVGPDFGPLAAVAVGLMLARYGIARRGAVALLVGFPFAIAVTAVLALLARLTGLIDPSVLHGGHRATDFIYHPGWFSIITAVVAGAAGMLSLTSSKSSALVGVFISVTTIPAAGNVAVGAVLGDWHETWLSLAQLGINLVGIVVAGVLTLIVLQRASPASAGGVRRSGVRSRSHVAAHGDPPGRGVQAVRGLLGPDGGESRRRVGDLDEPAARRRTGRSTGPRRRSSASARGSPARRPSRRRREQARAEAAAHRPGQDRDLQEVGLAVDLPQPHEADRRVSGDEDAASPSNSAASVGSSGRS